MRKQKQIEVYSTKVYFDSINVKKIKERLRNQSKLESQFVEVLAHNQLTRRQGGVVEGHHTRETVHGKAGTAESSKQQASDRFFASFLYCIQTASGAGSTQTKEGQPKSYPELCQSN